MRDNLDITFYLIRHAETDRNIPPQSELIGQSSEEPINQNGIEQSKKLSARFKKEGIIFDTIYCSPYLRAKQTCNFISEVMPKNISIITVPEIREINQGDGKNKSRTEVYSKEFKEKWDFLGMASAFPNGESLFDVQFRAWKWLEKEVLSNPYTRSDKPLNIALITHGMTIKVLLHAIMNFDHRLTWKIRTDNTSIAKVKFVNNEWHLYSINDTAHLQGEIK